MRIGIVTPSFSSATPVCGSVSAPTYPSIVSGWSTQIAVIAVRWPVEAAVSKVTMAPATAEPELSLTVPWIAPGAFPWAAADWAQANPGRNIIQRAAATHGIITREIDCSTAAAVRVNPTAIRGIFICSQEYAWK